MRIVHAHRYAEGAMEALETLCGGGHVLATYRRVMNIRTSVGRLIGIQTQNTPLSPFGIEIRADGSISWPPTGTACDLQGQYLMCGPLVVDLGFMRLASGPNIPALDSASSAEHSVALLEPYASRSAIPVKRATQQVLSAQQPLAQSLHHLSKLVHRSDGGTSDDLIEIKRLIGWGVGATPSGDDFLIGFFGSWSRLSPAAPPPRELLTNLASIALKKTTPLAAEFYLHLAKGRLSEPIDDLLHAIGVDDREGIESAANKLAGFGASSGFDTMAGIRQYLRASVHR